MDIWIVRTLLVAVLTYAAVAFQPVTGGIWANALFGLGLSGAVLLFEMRIRRLSLKTLVGALVGSITGILGATLISLVISRMTAIPVGPGTFLQVLIILLMAYVGLVVGGDKGNLLNVKVLEAFFEPDRAIGPQVKLLDTSAIIDGRIADICETGFVDGIVMIPQFVLHELQLVADSADSNRRNRGRRGLDVLQRLQKIPHVNVQITDRDFPEIREVDLKLLELAQELKARIVTSDLNLNKVAQVRGVRVLNLNDLANALKPVVLPGETLRVVILKEGKEENQGVAYLDDGTMVVVDDSRSLIGRTVEVSVTSMLQTTAGKLIFARVSRTVVDSPRDNRTR